MPKQTAARTVRILGSNRKYFPLSSRERKILENGTPRQVRNLVTKYAALGDRGAQEALAQIEYREATEAAIDELQAEVDELRKAQRAKKRRRPQDKPFTPSPAGQEILEVLAKAQTTLFQVDIESACHVKLRTIKVELPLMEKARLVHRGGFKRKGWAITEAGREVHAAYAKRTLSAHKSPGMVADYERGLVSTETAQPGRHGPTPQRQGDLAAS